MPALVTWDASQTHVMRSVPPRLPIYKMITLMAKQFLPSLSVTSLSLHMKIYTKVILRHSRSPYFTEKTLNS